MSLIPCGTLYTTSCKTCANEECKTSNINKGKRKLNRRFNIELDVETVFEKFCCKVCFNYDSIIDKCLITGDTDIAWRAHRTCCGVKEWHISRRP